MCSMPYKVSYLERALDAIGAANYLQELPFVKSDSIGILGFSHGGGTVIDAAKKNLSLYVAKMESIPFKAAVAFYPWCETMNGIDIPTLILVGE